MKGFFPHLIKKAKEKTWQKPDLLNLNKLLPLSGNGFEMPVLEDTPIEVEGFILFNYATSAKRQKENSNCTVCFFLDDYQFERVWTSPEKYAAMLQNYNGVLSPDFSLYIDMPIALQIYNVYRSRWCAQYWQQYGMSVVPTLQWSNEKSYCFCFEGLQNCSQVAVSTTGIIAEFEENFVSGFLAAMEIIKPKEVVWYGNLIDGFKAEDYCKRVKYFQPFFKKFENV